VGLFLGIPNPDGKKDWAKLIYTLDNIDQTEWRTLLIGTPPQSPIECTPRRVSDRRRRPVVVVAWWLAAGGLWLGGHQPGICTLGLLFLFRGIKWQAKYVKRRHPILATCIKFIPVPTPPPLLSYDG
jgi:hypothetical protein